MCEEFASLHIFIQDIIADAKRILTPLIIDCAVQFVISMAHSSVIFEPVRSRGSMLQDPV